MRLLVLSVTILCAACLGATCAIAQSGQWGQAEDQIPPYHTHVDRRHGNDHVYPDRGAVLCDLPAGAVSVNYAGIAYRFAGGVWYQQLGPAYIVVAPPIGLIVPQLPPFATRFDSAGKTYLYANDVFYRPRPDLGGYEVVNDPEDLAPVRSPAPGMTQSPRVSGDTGARQLPGTPAASRAPVGASPSRVASATSAAPPPPPPAPAQPVVEPKSMTPPPAPSVASTDDSPAPSNPTGVMIHPRNGQSLDQQALDRYECYRFAVRRSGFDPLASNSGMSAGEIAQRDTDYSRAQAACLEGRGYSLQ